MSFSTIVIGGGVAGLSAAWALVRRGERVLVLDGRSAAPRASLAAAGMLAPSFELGPDEIPPTASVSPVEKALGDFSRQSLAQWPEFAAELEEVADTSIDLQSGGILGIAFDGRDLDQLRLRYRAMADVGAKVELLSADEVRAAAPGISPAIVGGLFAAGEGQVDPVRVIDALTNAITRFGGRIVTGIVTAVQHSGAGVEVMLASEPAPVLADRAIIATGARNLTLKSLRGEAALPAPVRPVKGEAMALSLSALAGPLPFVVRAPGAYLCPKADGRVVVGATQLEDRHNINVDQKAVDRLRAHAEKVAPCLEGIAECGRWAGLRPGTPDNAPILGPAFAHDRRIIYALGGYRNGVLLAPAMAQLAADGVNSSDIHWPEAFVPARFAVPKTLARAVG